MSSVDLKQGLCSSCEKRHVCKTMCPEAELYANQDQVDWGETPVTHFDQDGEELSVFEPTPEHKTVTLTALETKVLVALNAGYTREQVAEIMGISRGHLRKVIHSCKKKYGKEP